MGYELYREVLDYAPTTLTHREKLLLAVLADDAKETTRITYSAVESPKILRRAKLTRRQLYEVLKSLTAKNTLKKITHGQRHAEAKYMIMPLAPTQSAEKPHADNQSQGAEDPHTDDSQGAEIRDSGCGNPVSQGAEKPHPYSSTPSTTSSSPDASRDADPSAGQGGGGGIDPQLLRPAGELVGALDYRGRVPTVPQQRQLSSLVARALNAGWSEPDLKAYLDLGDAPVQSASAVYLHRLSTEQLPDAPASRPAAKPAPGCEQCDDGYYDTGNGWAACPHCNRNAA
jgi:hypothetical protein